ncbi:MAG TPA: TIGR03546 family protein [Spirochaetales bacterium]|nr:TIGR03546 family protein [Spirochaetales bacterium]HRY56292.1 TIGR03546 family protein [Spirochaetia bacterium]
MIKAIARALAALNSNQKREQVAAGFAFGLLFALLPAGNLLWLLLFILTFFLKLNYAMQVLAALLLSPFRALLGGALDALGWAILGLPFLQAPFTALYNAPLAPLTRFNNSLVMGGLAAGLALWLPAFLAMRSFVSLYRAKLAPRVAGSRLYKAFLKLPILGSIAKATSALSGAAGGLG